MKWFGGLNGREVIKTQRCNDHQRNVETLEGYDKLRKNDKVRMVHLVLRTVYV
jgi:hypothetical protein